MRGTAEPGCLRCGSTRGKRGEALLSQLAATPSRKERVWSLPRQAALTTRGEAGDPRLPVGANRFGSLSA
jgi:hypothetical protein